MQHAGSARKKSEVLPPFLIPRPDTIATGARAKYLDPGSPDDPTPADPGSGGSSCNDGSNDDSGSQTGWGKVVKIGRKLIDAFKRGEDVFDPQLWKNLLENEWVEAAEAGRNVQAALNGDVVALLEVIDYAFEQLTGFAFFDALTVLKGADYLGLDWYDNVTEAITSSRYFPGFVHSINDLGTLEETRGA